MMKGKIKKWVGLRGRKVLRKRTGNGNGGYVRIRGDAHYSIRVSGKISVISIIWKGIKWLLMLIKFWK